MRKTKQLWGIYQFPGFRPEHRIAGVFGDPYAVVIRLRRRGKKRSAARAARGSGRFTIERFVGFGTLPAGIGASTWRWRFAGYTAEAAGR